MRRPLFLCARTATLALALGSALAVTGAYAQADPKVQVPIVQKQALLSKLRSPALRDAAKQMATLAKAPAFDADQVDALLANPTLDAVARDHLRSRLIGAAREVDLPSPALEAYVRKLVEHEDEVLTWHEEGPLPVPYFSVASAADGTLSLWQRRRTTRELTAAFAQGERPDLTLYFVPPVQDKQSIAKRYGAVDALRELPDAQLADVRDELLRLVDRQPGVLAPLGLIAQKTADPALFRTLVASPSTLDGLALVRAATSTLAPADAYAVLVEAHANAGLSSTALYAMGDLIDRVPGVRDYLLGALGDPASGGSAAAVIAKAEDRLLLDAVAKQLADDGAQDDRHRARLVLALRLASTTSARQQLRAALANGVIYPTHLAEEVRAWLGE